MASVIGGAAAIVRRRAARKTKDDLGNLEPPKLSARAKRHLASADRPLLHVDRTKLLPRK